MKIHLVCQYLIYIFSHLLMHITRGHDHPHTKPPRHTPSLYWKWFNGYFAFFNNRVGRRAGAMFYPAITYVSDVAPANPPISL